MVTINEKFSSIFFLEYESSPRFDSMTNESMHERLPVSVLYSMMYWVMGLLPSWLVVQLMLM